MTSWFDVSAHDLHGVHQIALGGQQQQEECTTAQQAVTFYGMVTIGAVKLPAALNRDGNA